MIRAIAADAQLDAEVEEGGKGRGDLLDRRRRRDGDRHHVVDQQRRRRDQRRLPAEVPLRHGVGAAAGRVGQADLAVAEGDRDQQDGDRAADPDAERQRRDAAEDQDPEDLLGRVGRRADRVGAEDRERLLLREALADLLLAARAAGRGAAPSRGTRPDPRRSAGRTRRPSRSAGPGRSSGRARSAGGRPGPGVAGLPALEGSTAADHGRPVTWPVTARPGVARSRRIGRPAARISAWTAATS